MGVFFIVRVKFLYYIWKTSSYPADLNGVVLEVGDHVGVEDPIWPPRPFFLGIELH